MIRPALAALGLALLLTACGSDHDPQPGEVSASEDRQLDQAAAATDINAASANSTDASQ